jgi:hypothetical protein
MYPLRISCFSILQIRFSDKVIRKEKRKYADETPEIGMGFIILIVSAIFIGVGLNGFAEFRMASWEVQFAVSEKKKINVQRNVALTN